MKAKAKGAGVSRAPEGFGGSRVSTLQFRATRTEFRATGAPVGAGFGELSKAGDTPCTGSKVVAVSSTHPWQFPLGFGG